MIGMLIDRTEGEGEVHFVGRNEMLQRISTDRITTVASISCDRKPSKTHSEIYLMVQLTD